MLQPAALLTAAYPIRSNYERTIFTPPWTACQLLHSTALRRWFTAKVIFVYTFELYGSGNRNEY